MRISLTRFLTILSLLLFTTLFSSPKEEAKRNLDSGYYIVAEYLYNDLVESGQIDEEVLVGLSISLVNQNKYQELIDLAQKYFCDNAIYLRNIAYAYFINNDYQISYFYYNQATKQDDSSLPDISGRGWSAYYLGKYSLANEDFRTINHSEYCNTVYDGSSLLKKYWNSNYSSIFVTVNADKVNFDLNYSFHYYNYSMGINYNQNRKQDTKREMITLHANLKSGKFSYDFSSMNAKGDYNKLYNAYGLALKSSYLMMFKTFQSTISLLGGYAYYESLSSQQIRADILLNNQRFGISSGFSYLYLDYITPDYDQKELLYHGSIYYTIIPTITINYSINIGKGNFAYNEYLVPYDAHDIKNLWQSVGISTSFQHLTLYLAYINRDLEQDSRGIGVSYVF